MLRRARTQLSPQQQAGNEGFNWQTPLKDGSPTTLRCEADIEEEKKELFRLDLLFNLIVRRNITSLDQFDGNVKAHGASYSFYQTKRVL